jgi:hypothetical protein
MVVLGAQQAICDDADSSVEHLSIFLSSSQQSLHCAYIQRGDPGSESALEAGATKPTRLNTFRLSGDFRTPEAETTQVRSNK